MRVGAGYRYEDLFDVKYSTNIGFDENAQPILPGSPMRDMTDTAGAVYPEKMRKSHYVFLQDSWQLAQKLDLTWGLRYDRYSDFGSTTNPRAALVWQATPNLTVKALYGRAFRAPSFRDLYTRNNALLLGNSELDAETNETTELALNWRASGALNVGFNLYQFEIKDKILAIDTDVATQQALITVNEGQLDGHGVELEARWKFSSRASVLFNYSWMDTELILPAEDEAGHETHGHEDDSDESGLPKQQAYLRVDWLIKPKWYLNTQLTWIGEQARIKHTDSRPPIDDYTSVDLTLRYKDTRQQRWNFALGVRNLFDKAIRVQADENLPGDIPLAGRNYFAEIRYRFD